MGVVDSHGSALDREVCVCVGVADSHGTVVADVVVVGYLGVFAVGPAAADLVRRVPHHLRVVAHLEQAVVVGSVVEDVLLPEPAFDGEIPAGERVG